MEFWLETADGRQFTLPEVLSWRFSYGMGEPCDSFRVECLWGMGGDRRLDEAVRFHAAEGNVKRFTGVVDEYRLRWDRRGGRLILHGRGMAALLLDNEALGADYQMATPADLIRDHVRPYGIEVLGGEELPSVPGFSVESGSSEWNNICRFARYYGGTEPRFDREGRLVLTGLRPGPCRVVGPRTPLTELERTGTRYGVLSEVLVRDRTGRGSSLVRNEAFCREGGRRRAVLTLPRKSGYEAMRWSGDYQLRRSAEERDRLRLRCPLPFFAFPGEVLDLRLERPRLAGRWRVRESECGGDAGGVYTELELSKEDEIHVDLTGGKESV